MTIPTSPESPSGTTRSLAADFAAPVDDRWFEDYVEGASYEYGTVGVTEDEIIAFARLYDPQPIHIDPAYAASGPFGGIIASGWHTSALAMRLLVEHYISHVASLASPGMDELRWPRPVRPGDTLHVRVTVTGARASASKPDRGLVHSLIEMLNQDDEVVFSVTGINFMSRRPEG